MLNESVICRPNVTPKMMSEVLTLYCLVISYDLRAHTVCLASPGGLFWLLTIVNKVSFESTQGQKRKKKEEEKKKKKEEKRKYWKMTKKSLCASYATNKAEMRCINNLCHPVCRNIEKKEPLVHMDMEMAGETWTVWIVHFAERIEGKLATFTVCYLIDTISYALITIVLLFFLVVQLRVAMAFRCSVCNCEQAQ